MRKSSKNYRQANPTFVFVVDGETETWYLQMLKRNEPQLRLNIKPEIPNKKSIEEQFKLVVDLSKKEYLKVFWIVDLDTIIKEHNETPKGKKSSLQTFIEKTEIIKNEYKSIIVIINNPCLEFWFLLQFEKTSKQFDSCAKLETELRKINNLSDYEKTQKYYTKQNNDIYKRLKPFLNTAIDNSLSLGQFDKGEHTKAISEMFLLFQTDELKNIIKTN